jgi:hypothetical protein
MIQRPPRVHVLETGAGIDGLAARRARAISVRIPTSGGASRVAPGAPRG